MENKNIDQSNLTNINTSIIKQGLHLDNSPVNQPKGTYRYALNTVDETKEGDLTFLSNEKGNLECLNLKQGYVILGKRYINNDRIVILSSNGINSEIGILSGCNGENCSTYIEYVNSSCLGFNVDRCKQIDITYRLRKGCEDTIYFVDGFNEDRYFNFQNLNLFYTDAYNTYIKSGGDPNLYTGEKWDCNKFKLTPQFLIPCFENIEVLQGQGTLYSGTYNFSIQLLDADNNATNWIYASQLVSIYNDDLNGSNYDEISGNTNLAYDSNFGTIPTNKAIKLFLSNLDIRYTSYKIAVIESSAGNGIPNKVYVSPIQIITDDTFVWNGNIEGYTETTIEELQIKKSDQNVSEHIEQIENRLIKANIKGKQINWCDFQKFASKIASSYVIKHSDSRNIEQEGDAKNPTTYWNTEGYMGDETYAFGIVYVFDDGFESPAYHIPGRPLNNYYNPITKLCTALPFQDDSLVTPSSDTEHLTGTLFNHRVYDTSYNYSGLVSGIDETFGAMQYHENNNSNYDEILNNSCSNGDYWGEDFCGNSLKGTPTRHHKFPSRYKEPHVSLHTGIPVDDSEYCVYIKLELGTTDIVTYLNTLTYPFTLTLNYNYNGIPQPTVTYIITSSSDLYSFYLNNGEYIQCYSDNLITAISLTGFTNIPGEITFSTPVIKNTISIHNNNCNEKLRHLGIKFDNIQYPHPDIIGHYFVRGNRDDSNRTCLDGGYLCNTHYKSKSNKMTSDYYGFTYFTANNSTTAISNSKFNILFSPKFYFINEIKKGLYIKYNNRFRLVHKEGSYRRVIEEVSGGFANDINWLFAQRDLDYCGTEVDLGQINRKIEKYKIEHPLSNSNDLVTSFWNTSEDNSIQVLELKDNFITNNGDYSLFYTTYKVDNEVHPNLFNILYQRTHNCTLKNTDINEVFGGDTFISHWNLFNTVNKEVDEGVGAEVLGVIASTIILAAGVILTLASAGLAFPAVAAGVSVGIAAAIGGTAALVGLIAYSAAWHADAMLYKDLTRLLDDSDIDNTFSVSGATGWRDRNYVVGENLNHVFVESEINVGLRNKIKKSDCEDYYKFDKWTLDYLTNKWVYQDVEDNNKWKNRGGVVCQELYYYNKDYSRENQIDLYFSLSQNYNCCSNCLESHPNRVVYSEQSFQEEQSDNYRVFKSNNYRDIEGEYGEITGLWKYGNNLYIHSSETLWELPQSVQERVTNELVSYLGTGEYFSIPPRKILDDELGSAGSQHKWATIKTRYGVIFVNQIEGKIYNYKGQLEEISNKGLRNYFENNLKDFFCCQFTELTGLVYDKCNCNATDKGIGIHSFYDTRFNRVIITKLDYLITQNQLDNFTTIDTSIPIGGYINNQLYYDTFTNNFVATNNNGLSFITIDFLNKDYFENKSFTISYSFHTDSWKSWHSYLPNMYLYSQNYFYSSLANNSTIWKHNIDGIYQTFYNKLYPHIIEYVSLSSAVMTRLWDSLQLNTIAKKYNTESKQNLIERYITYNKIVAYNEEQCTGEIEMIVKDTETNVDDYMIHQIYDRLSNQQLIITREERNWNLNELRDLRIDYSKPIFKTTWQDIRNEFPIDKVIDATTIDYNKDWTELQQLRDKHLVIRLIFDKFDNINLIFNYSFEQETNSIR